MIFITLGSQKFQFNRILKEIDTLIDDDLINEEVFAQIGNSNYVPRNFQYKQFLDREEFKEYIMRSDIVITHGGTGAIMTAVKENKIVIAVPRLQKYGEHVNDHQIQIVKNFEQSNIVFPLYDIDKLGSAIKEARNKEFSKYISNSEKVISDIETYLNNSWEKKK